MVVRFTPTSENLHRDLSDYLSAEHMLDCEVTKDGFLITITPENLEKVTSLLGHYGDIESV